MLRSLPLLPTLLGVNLWLIALLVPLCLGRATASGLAWAVAPLGLLALLLGLGLRRYRATAASQILLIIGVPLLVFLPTADGALAAAKLHPPSAVMVQLAVLVGYLAAVCAELARGPQPADLFGAACLKGADTLIADARAASLAPRLPAARAGSRKRGAERVGACLAGGPAGMLLVRSLCSSRSVIWSIGCGSHAHGRMRR